MCEHFAKCGVIAIDPRTQRPKVSVILAVGMQAVELRGCERERRCTVYLLHHLKRPVPSLRDWCCRFLLLPHGAEGQALPRQGYGRLERRCVDLLRFCGLSTPRHTGSRACCQLRTSAHSLRAFCFEVQAAAMAGRSTSHVGAKQRSMFLATVCTHTALLISC